MAVDTEHPDYRRMSPDWQRMRDVLAGQRAMREPARDYLRRPIGLTDNAEWGRYVEATPFFEATLRTQEGLTGLAFYRDPEVKVPDALQPFVDDATQDGVPLIQFTESVFEEVNGLGRVGVLVDMPERDPKIRSRRDEELAKRRPFVRYYQTEDIFNWATGKVNGAVVLTQVRLREWETKQLDDFTSQCRKVIRVLELVQIAEVWTYRQRVFKHNEWVGDDGAAIKSTDAAPAPTATTEPAEAWTEESPITPLMDGKPLDFIPFWIINPTDQSPKVKRPPMLGLANANIAHFNTSASLENALFWVGNPQPWVSGVDPTEFSALRIGSSEAWVFKDATAKVGLLSLESDKVGGLEKRLDRLEQHMAILGAKMLSADKRAAEAAETARIHRQGEVSVLAGVCGSVSRAMTDVLRVVCQWAGTASDAAKLKVQTAFYDAAISLDDALKAVSLWQKGVISIEDLISILKKGELIDSTRTVEEIASQNQSSVIQPIMPGLTDTSVGSSPGDPPEPKQPPQRPTLTRKPPPAKE
jgi:hypothetical protein